MSRCTLFVCVCLGLPVAASPSTPAQDPAPASTIAAAAAADPFVGKFLSIVTRSDPESVTDLEAVRIVDLGGRSFLVGRGAKLPMSWQRGLTVWVALDDVSQIVVFDSFAEMLSASISVEENQVDP